MPDMAGNSRALPMSLIEMASKWLHGKTVLRIRETLLSAFFLGKKNQQFLTRIRPDAFYWSSVLCNPSGPNYSPTHIPVTPASPNTPVPCLFSLLLPTSSVRVCVSGLETDTREIRPPYTGSIAPCLSVPTSSVRVCVSGLETGKLKPSSQTGSSVRYLQPVDSLVFPSTIRTRGLGSAAARDAICPQGE